MVIPRLPSLIGALLLALTALLIPFPLATARAPIETPIARYMMDVYADGRVQLSTLTHTPWPTYTPQETVTHEQTPTLTPSLSPTATHTPTRTPTATTAARSATPEPTPTQAVTLTTLQPTTTPTPSPTVTPPIPPDPDPKCWGTTNANLNVRDLPSYEWLGTIPQGDTVAMEATYLYFGDVWYQHYWITDPSDPDKHIEGYSHSAYIDIAPEQQADCDALPDVTPQEAHSAALLWHTVPGFNIGNAQVSYGILGNKGIGYGLKPYAGINECLDALNRGGVCIYRHGAPDCPQNIGSSDPRQSAREFLQWGQAAQAYLASYENAYYEPLNECQFGGSQSDHLLSIIYWWDEFLDEYITQAVARGFPKLVIPTMGPGHGEAIQYRIWKDELNRLAASGGMIGEHAYTPYHDEGLCSCDEWLACRHRKNEKWRQAEGVDIDVAITEAARGWGNDPVNVDDFVCWYEIVRGDEFLHSVSLWTAGWHPTWPNANLDAYMVPIARGVH